VNLILQLRIVLVNNHSAKKASGHREKRDGEVINMPDLKNCPKCGKLYVYTGRFLCPACIAAEEEEFQKIKEYLLEHRGANVLEVAQATGIEEEVIIKFIKKGRIQSEGLTIVDRLTCEKCGREIENGKFCPDCLEKMQKELQQVGRRMQDKLANESKMKGKIHTASGLKQK